MISFDLNQTVNNVFVMTTLLLILLGVTYIAFWKKPLEQKLLRKK